MSNDLEAAISRLCLAFPGAEESISHGSLTYRVNGGRVFATYVVNHHGDGRIALWLSTPADLQDACVRAEPEYFFVPPYVGVKGWLGVRLDADLEWERIAPLVREAYERVAPARQRARLTATPAVPAPRRRVTLAEVDPRNTPRAKQVLASMREICLALPETSEHTQFGHPVWRAGRKVFAQACCYEGKWHVSFWVGVEAQLIYTVNPRYSIPPYMGHNGWIALDVSKRHTDKELRPLALQSYQHFALKRMLEKLPSS